MESDELRSHRLNYLLQFHLENKNEPKLFQRAKKFQISDSTVKDYYRLVMIQARKIESIQKRINKS